MVDVTSYYYKSSPSTTLNFAISQLYKRYLDEKGL